jgi:hypothetical protein
MSGSSDSDDGTLSAGAGESLSHGGKQFDALARQAGLAVVGNDGSVVPEIRIEEDLAVVAWKLGQVMHRVELFGQNGKLVFIDYEGELKTMTPTILRTWLQGKVIMFVKRVEDRPVPTVLTKDAASVVLESEQFRRGVRVLRGVNEVRLPVIRAGKSLPELLPYGYDEETGIFTVDKGLNYDEQMAIEAARGWIDRTFGMFPLSSPRSMAVLVGGLAALYVRHLPGGGGIRPGFLGLANKPESGKSVLMKAMQYPVLGRAPAVKMKHGEQLDKEIEAFLIAGRPCVFLDNVYGKIESATLDQMLTSEESEGRAMGGHGLFRARNSALLLVTGNRVELNEDAERRFLVVDLFEQGDPTERGVERGNLLNDDVMKDPDWRKRMLAVLWALVRNWGEAGRPEGSVLRGTFETYSRVLGGIVEAAGYVPPFQRAEIPDAINPEQREFLELLALIVEDMGLLNERDYTLVELARFARIGQVFEREVGTVEDGRRETIKQDKLPKDEINLAVDKGYMSRAQQTSFGLKIKKRSGEEMKVGGIRIEFGKREQARKSTWTVTLRK